MRDPGEGGGVEALAEAQPAPKRVWPSIVTLVMGLMGSLFGGCIGGVFFVPHDGTVPDLSRLMRDPAFLIVSLAVTQLGLFFAVRAMPGALRDVQDDWHERVAWRTAGFSVIDVVLGTVGAAAVGTVTLTLLAPARVPGIAFESFAAGAATGSDAQFLGLLLFGAVLPGLVEELAFRGLLQTRLVERYGPAVGITLASVIFGVWHLDPQQGLTALVLGGWFGWLAWRQDTIVNVALVHTLNNALAFLLARTGGIGARLSVEARLVVWSALLVCCGVLLHRRTRGRSRLTRG
ncbi:MAG: CPBP family intramembrane glutamic endopeptidase [Myxococcota bacterium]